MQFPAESREWYKHSNHLCMLSVEDEEELMKLCIKCQQKGIKFVEFREPDIGGSLTAICLEASEATKRVVQKLPLMLK